MDKTFKYQVFGLCVLSEIELPIPEFFFDIAQVEICFGETPWFLGCGAKRGVVYEALPNAVLIKVFDIARFHITNGSTISVQRLEKYDAKSAAAFIMGSVFASLLYQRGIMPFHASALEYQGKSIIICGTSGAGKSTLALGLTKHGFRIICDDISPVSFLNGHPVLSSGFNQSKIWKDTATKMNIPVDGLSKVRDSLDKYYYKSEESVVLSDAVPLNHLFILASTTSDNLDFKQFEGKDKILSLKSHLFRKQIAFSMGLEAKLFIGLTKVASAVPVTKIERFSNGFALERPIQHILQSLSV